MSNSLVIPSLNDIISINPLILTLQPAIQPMCSQHILRSYQEGIPAKVIQGRRTREYQMELWLKGRDPATGQIVDPSKVVTKLKVGWHNLGLAYDLGLLRQVKKADGTVVEVVTFDNLDRNGDKINDWKQLADIGVELGMDAGFYWTEFVDEDHFERHRGLTLASAISRDDRGLDVVTGQPKMAGQPMFA